MLTEGTCVVASNTISDRYLCVFQGATIKVTNGAAWFPGETTNPTGGGAKRDMGNVLNTAIHAGCRDIHLPGGRSWNLFTTVRIASDPRIKGGRGGVAVSWLVELDVNNIM